MLKVVHLAGNDVRIENRVIQRCLICGAKLVDVNLDLVAVPTADDAGPIGVFAVGHLIEVTDGNPTQYLDVGDSREPSFDAAWADCCINVLVE